MLVFMERDANDDDAFEELLGLEEKYYEEGYSQGLKDGLHQSRLQARIFGIEKGFEKYLEMGKLHARARYWSEDLQALPQSGQKDPASREQSGGINNAAAKTRLKKHLDILLALTDPSTLTTENTDEAVSLFDDRLKRAQAKCIIVERMLREEEGSGFRTGMEDKESTDRRAAISNF